MSLRAHDKIRTFLMNALRSQPYRNDMIPPTMEDILAADKAIWVELAEKHQGMQGWSDPSSCPLDQWVQVVLEMPKITFMIQHRMMAGPTHAQGSGATKPGGTTETPGGKGKGGGKGGQTSNQKTKNRNARRKRQAQELQELKALYAEDNPKGKGRGKGKGRRGRGRGGRGNAWQGQWGYDKDTKQAKTDGGASQA